MAELQEGESIEIEGNKGRRYTLSKIDGFYSCTCVSWKMCRGSRELKTCKHVEKFLTDDEKADYIVEGREFGRMRESGVRIPLSRLRKNHREVAPHAQLIENPDEIERAIFQLSEADNLWLDTEVADWKAGPGRLSLIQALSDKSKCTAKDVVVLDVLNYPDLIALFDRRIMHSRKIVKIFHNAQYDLKYLGCNGYRSVECTLVYARQLARHYDLPRSLGLQSLAEYFGLADDVDKTEQKSDWAVRPLSADQIHYAIMDVVYLRGIDLHLNRLES